MSSLIQVISWKETHPITEQEAEAKLHREGYESFRWHDVPGAQYPRHRHSHDECIWLIRGTMVFEIDGNRYELSSGDRLYLPAKTAHTAEVSSETSATYLVGQKLPN